MSISGAINSALTGLKATQAGIDLVSNNVANSGTVGYTRRVLLTREDVAGGRTTGVNVLGAQRILDTLLQKQIRLENAGAGYTSVKASYHYSLDGMFDAPGATGSLTGLMSSLSTALSALATNPSTFSNRTTALSAAADLAASLNSLSGQVQSLRQTAEGALGAAVSQANSLLQQIAQVSTQMRANPANADSPGLQDQRDLLIDQLSQLMDVQVTPKQNGVVSISTTGGLLLFDGQQPVTLGFDAQSPIGPQSFYDADPAKRRVGTITATNPQGGRTDVLASGMIRSGTIAAYIELRDEVLVQAQTQLDAVAAGLASAMSDRDLAGAAVTSGGQTGFDLDLSALQNGNPVTVSVTAGGVPRTVTFVRTGSAAAAAAATASGNGVIGIDFSGGMASVAGQIGTVLGPGFAVSSPAGSTLRILDDGAAGTTDVRGLSGRATVTALNSGEVELPLFTDGAGVYTGSYENGSQLAGFAARITVNAAVKNDPSLLVAYTPSTPAADTARPDHLRDALSTRTLSFTGAAGIGGSSAPWSGTISEFANQVVATQATNAISAGNLDSGQKVVLNALQSRFSEQSGVNIDVEMAQLIQLQTAYGANARVMTAAKEMLDMLMSIGA
ncbi:flagellar hook-associated protein FlgK [Enterovirga aerilata]|uniref:Flagellar hook-associated protein 1 n=1 Tax=Enterovirga aerilata TaxID=2730920 RepID=A0A849I5F8_9HYPH|nr:flagellar hook-associated protein FlgK [Enterovirga sp. DB1703]